MSVFDDFEVDMQELVNTDTGEVVGYLFTNDEGRTAVLWQHEINDAVLQAAGDTFQALVFLRALVDGRFDETVN